MASKTSKVPGIALAGLLVLGAGWSGGWFDGPVKPGPEPMPAAVLPGGSAWLETIKPCLQEDGNGPEGTYPCYWDAATRGNGLGHSVLYVRTPDGACPPYRWAALPVGATCIDVTTEEVVTS